MALRFQSDFSLPLSSNQTDPNYQIASCGQLHPCPVVNSLSALCICLVPPPPAPLPSPPPLKALPPLIGEHIFLVSGLLLLGSKKKNLLTEMTLCLLHDNTCGSREPFLICHGLHPMLISLILSLPSSSFAVFWCQTFQPH